MYDILFIFTQLAEAFVLVTMVTVVALGKLRRKTKVLALVFGLSFLPTLYLRMCGSLIVFYMEWYELRRFALVEETVKLIRGVTVLILMAYLYFRGFIAFKPKGARGKPSPANKSVQEERGCGKA